MFKPSIDQEWYLANNPDVAASGLSAKEHYKKFGRAEGRLPCPPRLTPPSKIEILIGGIIATPGLYGGIYFALRFLLGTWRKKGFQAFKSLIAENYYRSGGAHGDAYYPVWQILNELNVGDIAEAKQHLREMSLQPLISIVMPTYNSNLKWLNEAIESVVRQPYENWELCIADDASPNAEVRKLLTAWSTRDSRIKVVYRQQNGHISDASNSALEITKGEWVALFDHDDLFHPFALYWVLRAINQNPNSQLIYSDEDKIDEKNYRQSPYFKSDWNYDLFLSQNCFSHLGLLRRELINRIGGFRKGLEGSQDHDLVLRAIEHIDESQIIHIPKVLYHWRVHADSTAKSSDSKPYAALAGERAINEHLQRQGRKAEVSFEGYGYRVKYALPNPLPLVSLIIPTRNGLSLLRQCIESIIEKTIYKNYEFIIVDNGSDDSATVDYLTELSAKANFKVLRDDRPFNYSQLNNLAVRVAQGSVIGLINNDIEVIEPDWLNEMVSHVLRPEVGAVGAKLLFPNNTLQHGGVLLGVGGVANHAHLNIPGNHHGYFARMSVIQQFSAVTAACLLVRKTVYEEAGGLDEKNLSVAFNDVDFCIRLKKLGYKNIWTPYALLFHHESATRGQDLSPEKRERFMREVNYMMTTWAQEFISDPAYNPNLSLGFPDFSLSTKKRLGKWDLDFSAVTPPSDLNT
jgi:glycosyltransferase involved in cell wall biosynthesis